VKNKNNEFEIDLYSLRLHPADYKDFEIDSLFSEKISNQVIELDSQTPVKINLRASNVKSGFYLKGEIEYKLKGVCSKCLEDIEKGEIAKFESFFIEDKTDDDQNFVYELSGTHANLVPLIIDTIGENLEYQPLCRAECKGLCGFCGENLNLLENHTC
jgi:uncharacterized protein